MATAAKATVASATGRYERTGPPRVTRATSDRRAAWLPFTRQALHRQEPDGNLKLPRHPRKPHVTPLPVSYADAPRLPERGPIDLHTVLAQRCARLELEIGPGRGGFLLERLAARP